MAYGPSPIKRDSVISQAAQEICRYIEAEKLGPGDPLPPETRLSRSVRRRATSGSLRRAASRLCSAWLIRRFIGKLKQRDFDLLAIISLYFGAYCVSPFPNDQSSRALSASVIQTFCFRTPSLA